MSGCWNIRRTPAAEIREELDTRVREYVSTYRGILGLGYFVLRR
ncbi:MAG: hypothetical protein JWP76_2985 [Dactylosporangium sp.]|jgi:hypothetical protein|nr:hypothetical protein [Dactylosporangium sp.]